MTYVPSLDLYLDSTAESIEAGYLPSAVMDKPVLLAASGTMARTPAAQLDRHRTSVWFGLQADGSGRFKVSKTAEGAIAEPYRRAVRDTKPADRALFVRQILQGFGQQGKGDFDPGQVDGSGGRYTMGMQGSSDNLANLPGPFGMATSYNFWGGVDEALTGLAQQKERSQDFNCPAIDAEDELTLAFPAGVNIIALPKALALEDAHLRYRSQYLQQGNAVIIQRSLTFRHATVVCSGADYRRMQPLLERMLRDLKSQVIISGP